MKHRNEHVTGLAQTSQVPTGIRGGSGRGAGRGVRRFRCLTHVQVRQQRLYARGPNESNERLEGTWAEKNRKAGRQGGAARVRRARRVVSCRDAGSSSRSDSCSVGPAPQEQDPTPGGQMAGWAGGGLGSGPHLLL